MPAWTEDELRTLILGRMRRARYKTSFTDLLVTRLEGVKMSSQIVRTSRGYFRMLWDFTNGNPRFATHFWLRSLVPDDEKRRVRVHLFASPRIEELERLADDMAFVLVAVLEHGTIGDSELATITGFDPSFCTFALALCQEQGYLWRDPATGRSRATDQWQQTIIRYLKRKHLLYS
jgi:hypothetical protein